MPFMRFSRAVGTLGTTRSTLETDEPFFGLVAVAYCSGVSAF